MKFLLLFIYRLFNIIVNMIGGIIIVIMLATFPVWPLFGYLFKGADFFDTDGEDYIVIVWDAIHYPSNKLYEFIDDMDDTEFNFNKFLNNKFWK